MTRCLSALLIGAALALGVVAPAFGQACPPVSALPDSERRVAYAPSSSTGPFAVTFPLLGDSTDYGAWVEVWLNGVLLTPVTDWQLALTSGTVAAACRPISNAQVTLSVASSGTLQIIGARRPRRTSQFAENRGVAARDLNQVITDIVATQREAWDKINDVTGRGLFSQPGVTLGPLPTPAACANKFLAFSATGLVPLCNALASTGTIVIPGSTTIGDLVTWGDATGTTLSDPAISLDTSVANAFPGPSDPSQGNVTRGHKVAPLDANVVFGGNGVFPLQVVGSNPYAIGTAGTVASSTVGQIFSDRFTSTHLSGSPITVSYTAVGGDTVSTIGLALCNAVNANATLHNALTSLPAFCQSINQTSPGLFNLQWDVSYSDMAIASVGTGTINFGALNRTLDFAVMTLGRRVPGYVGQNGDNIACLQFQGQSTSGSMDAVVGNMCGTLNNATTMTGTVSFSASSANAGHAQFAIATGMLLYDSAGAFPTGGFKGIGTLNLPTTGAYYLAGNAVVQVSAAGAGGAGLVSIGTNAAIAWDATGGGVDSKWWDALNVGSTLSFRLVNDAQGSATNWMVVTRSAMSVTSINFPNGTLQAAGNKVLDVGTAVTAAQGGTGLSTYAVGDLIYASAVTPTLSRLADVAAGSVLVSGGVGVAPAWSANPSVNSVTIAVGSGGSNGYFIGSQAILQASGNAAGDNVFFRDPQGNLAFVIGATTDPSTYFNKDNTIFRTGAALEAFHFRNNKVHFEANNAGNGSVATSVGTCGTSPTIVATSTDFAGQITTGSTATTSCVITFAVAYNNPPFCDAWPVGAANSGLFNTPANATLTLTYTSATSQKFGYRCTAQAGG
jgi:hypothetical protein